MKELKRLGRPKNNWLLNKIFVLKKNFRALLRLVISKTKPTSKKCNNSICRKRKLNYGISKLISYCQLSKNWNRSSPKFWGRYSNIRRIRNKRSLVLRDKWLSLSKRTRLIQRGPLYCGKKQWTYKRETGWQSRLGWSIRVKIWVSWTTFWADRYCLNRTW